MTITDGSKSLRWLNEIEYINGEVWGMVWQTECIARVSPVDGKVLGWILMDGLTQVPPRPCRLLSHAVWCAVCLVWRPRLGRLISGFLC